MLIGDILNKFPRAAQIMEDYGLHCTGCSINAFETLRAGAMAHGLKEEIVEELISKLNKLSKKKKSRAPKDGIYMTEKAAKMVIEFAEKEDKKGWGLKITATENDDMEPTYAMDFQEKEKKGDKVFEFHGVAIFLEKESMKLLAGAEIDFLETQFGNGFKIENPNYASGCYSDECGCA